MRNHARVAQPATCVFLAAILAATSLNLAQAEDVIPITLDKAPAGKMSPADITRKKLAMWGTVDGQNWSIRLDFKDVSLENALEYLAECAKAKPREIRMIVNRKGIENAGYDLSGEPLTARAQNLSLAQALQLILIDGVGFAVQDDGALLVSSLGDLNNNLPTRCYEISQVLDALNDRGKNAEEDCPPSYQLRDLIERMVQGSEPWQSMGGRATLCITTGSSVMVVKASHDAQRQVVTLCRNLLVARQQRKVAALARLPEAEKFLARLRGELSAGEQAMHGLYVEAGADASRLSPAAIFAEVARKRSRVNEITIQLGGKRAALAECRKAHAVAATADRQALALAMAEIRVDVANLEGQARVAREQLAQIDAGRLLALGRRITLAKDQQRDLFLRVAVQRHVVRSFWERAHGVSRKASQETGVEQSPWPALSVDLTAVVNNSNAFACDLYKRLALRGKAGNRNLFYSPYSISTAMAMTYAGARGETEAQMGRAMHFSMPQAALHPAMGQLAARLQAGDDYELTMSNNLWGQANFEFKRAFIDLVAANYAGGFRQVDFIGNPWAAIRTINASVEKATKGRIKDLLASGGLGRDTRLILTNAIYFKGQWVSTFDKRLTSDMTFHLAKPRAARDPARRIDVPMMQIADKFRYSESDDLQMLELPYHGDDLTMIVLLPKRPGKDASQDYTIEDLAAMEQSLTAEVLKTRIAAMKPRRAQVYLPRFKMTCTFGLADVLKSMGMTDAFNVPKADFSGMRDERDLFISEVVHKAFVVVNEEGTEAAAATAVEMDLFGGGEEPEKPVVFRADHPFIFLIRSSATGSILFMGRVADPSS